MLLSNVMGFLDGLLFSVELLLLVTGAAAAGLLDVRLDGWL